MMRSSCTVSKGLIDDAVYSTKLIHGITMVKSSYCINYFLFSFLSASLFSRLSKRSDDDLYSVVSVSTIITWH